MNRIILIATFLVATLTACNSGAQNNQQATDDAATRKAIADRVTDIYTAICKAYPDDHGFGEDGEFTEFTFQNFDSLYCTKGWNQLLADIQEIDSRNPDDIGFFDFDYWIMGQDWGNLHFDNVDVKEVMGDTATVTLNWYNFGNCEQLELTLLREDGEWRIDNLQNLRQDMQEYIQQNR